MPNANLTLRKVPETVPDDVALFAGDVMGTAYHAVDDGQVKPGDTVAVLGWSSRAARGPGRESRPAPPKCSRSIPSSNGCRWLASLRRHGDHLNVEGPDASVRRR